LTVSSPARRVILLVQAANTRPRLEPAADGHGSCSHAGVVPLAELADRLGLTGELDRRANRGLPAPAAAMPMTAARSWGTR
jgi:hypothetical protein